MASHVQPRLIALGVAMVVVGVVVMAMTMMGLAGADPNLAAPIGSAIPADPVTPEIPPHLWTVLGGGSLAIGAALIGIGMSRWRSRRQRA